MKTDYQDYQERSAFTMMHLKRRVGDYVLLTKPRVMTLLIFSALGGAFLAARAVPQWEVLLAVIVGGALASGGAAALNMAIESKIDKDMGRTKSRPVADGRISRLHAGLFGVLLNVLAVVVFVLLAGWLAAVLAMVGTVLYLGLYTVFLKRRTVENIVIGGAAGSMPPLVGYAAVTGNLTLEAAWLAVIIFFWTPPHFWALALLIEADYIRAKIPMLPVVRGANETRLRIFLYTLLLGGIVVAFSAVSEPMSYLYLVSGALISAAMLWFAYKLWNQQTREAALTMYKFSLLHLFLLILVIAVDAVVPVNPAVGIISGLITLTGG